MIHLSSTFLQLKPKVFSFYIFFLLLPSLLQAQVISSLDTVSNSKNNIISSIEENKQPGISGWNETLHEFEEDDNIDEDIEEKILHPDFSLVSGEIREVTIDNETLILPIIRNKQGIDIFMLSDKGIEIYFSALGKGKDLLDSDTKKWIRYFVLHKKEMTQNMLKRYENWHKYLVPCFQKFGIPEELTLLCLIESGCTYDVTSSAGAGGMWQLMPATAREYGLIVSHEKDERFDPVKSTGAAAAILKSYKLLTGADWILVAASYNCGPGRLMAIMKKSKEKEWTKIKPHLPQETRQYIPSLTAIYYIWNYREELGFTSLVQTS